MGKPKENKERAKINNFNPYNKLSLNKFHQLKDHTQKVNLHKKKRDIQRLLKYKKEKGEQVVQGKIKQLDNINEKLTDRKKSSQRQTRKELYLKMKYEKIMDVEMTKIKRKLKSLRKTQQDIEQCQQYKQWVRKLNYVKHFPKNLKYVSLFPSKKPLQPQAIEFQNKLINDINNELEKQNQQLNEFGDEQQQSKKRKIKKDTFFIEAQSQPQPQEEIEHYNVSKKRRKVKQVQSEIDQSNPQKQNIAEQQEQQSQQKQQAQQSVDQQQQ